MLRKCLTDPIQFWYTFPYFGMVCAIPIFCYLFWICNFDLFLCSHDDEFQADSWLGFYLHPFPITPSTFYIGEIFFPCWCVETCLRRTLKDAIRSGTIITWSNIIWYCIYHWNARGRIQIRVWIHKNTPHSSPYRASHGVYFVRILQKIDRVITASHCNCLHDLSNWAISVLKFLYYHVLTVWSGCHWIGGVINVTVISVGNFKQLVISSSKQITVAMCLHKQVTTSMNLIKRSGIECVFWMLITRWSCGQPQYKPTHKNASMSFGCQ